MKFKHWFIIILVQISLVAGGLFLYHLMLGGTGIDPGDAITLWATVITIVFIVFNTSVKIYRTKKLNNGSRVTGSAI